MESAGKPTEKWMTIIPLSVFVFIVVFAMGGPSEFVRIVGDWMSDTVAIVARWLRQL